MTILVSFEDKKQAIAEWIEILSGVPLANIRGAEETGKFKYPAVVLAEISEIDTHRPFRRVEEIDGVLQFVVYASRQVMIDIHFITRSRGDYTELPAERIPDAGNYMAQFHSGLYLPEKSIEFLSKNDLSLLSVASPLRADEKKNDGWQRRRIIEIGFGYISQITEPISTIESIQNIKGTTYVLNDAIELEINLGPYQPLDEKGKPGGYAALDLNGEVPVDQLPARVKVRVFTVASEVEQLALTVHEGYICVRTDESKSYSALNDVNNSLADWQELSSAPLASVITEDALHRFVTDAEKNTWDAKQDALGFTPEDSAEKGISDGYASLDATGKVPAAQLPPDGGDVSGPGSSAVNEIAVYAGATGKLLKTVPVRIDPITRAMTGIGETEQDGSAFFPQNAFGVIWTNTGLASGTILGTLKVDSTGTFRFTGNEGTRFSISDDQVRIWMSDDTALYVVGGITTEKNLAVGADLSVDGFITGIQLISVAAKSGPGTVALTDMGKTAEFANGANDWTFTFPQDSEVDIPVRASGEIRKIGTGDLSIIRGTNTIFRGFLGDVDLKLIGEDGFSAFWEKTAANTFLISGSVEAA